MKLLGIELDGQLTLVEDFQNDAFLKAINSKLSEGKTSCVIGKGIDQILKYKDVNIFNAKEQGEIAKSLIALGGRAIIEGELSDIEHQSEQDRENVFVTFNTYARKAIQIIDRREGDVTLLTTMMGSEYGIFCTWENGMNKYSVEHTKKTSNDEYGYVVDEDGYSFDILKDSDFLYSLIQTSAGVEIWSGSIEAGFKKDALLKDIIAEEVCILKKGFVSYIEDNFFYIMDIRHDEDGVEVMCIEEGEVREENETGNIIDIYTHNEKSMFVYNSTDESGNMRYHIRNERNEDVFESSHYPHVILTTVGCHIVMYSNNEKKYYLADIASGVLSSSIIAFIDAGDNEAFGGAYSQNNAGENYYFGGNLPKSVLIPNGICELRFIYEMSDTAGIKTIQEGYIISGIESDITIAKPSQTIVSIFSDDVTGYTH